MNSKIGFTTSNTEMTLTMQNKWYPYAKGGEYRKWYGNVDTVVLWENDGYELRHYFTSDGKLKSRPQNMDDYFKELITWSAITSGKPSMRYINHCIYGGGGTAYVPFGNLQYTLALFNSKLAVMYLDVISPTLNYEAGHIMSIPFKYDDSKENEISSCAQNAINIEKDDWDSCETSWDFKRNPLV